MKLPYILSSLCRIPHLLLHPIAETRTLMLFSVLMSWAIAISGRYLDAPTDPFLSYLLPLADCYLACVLTWLLRKVWMGWLVPIFFTVLLFSELFTVFYYHSLYSMHVVLLILQTNTRESSELVHSALALPSTWLVVGITIALAAVSIQVGRWSRRSFKGKELLLLLLFALTTWSCLRQISAYKKLAYCFESTSVQECANPVNIPHLNTPTVRILYGLAFNMALSAELQQLPGTVEATRVDSCSYRAPLIVLVIGESYNKHHTPLYEPGYLPTTPRLLQQQAEGRLCVYTDAVSPFNFTSNSFKYMFTTWDETCADDWTRHTLFPAVFKKAVYNVHFVTNQFTMASTDMWDMAGSTIFNQPQLSDLQFTSRNKTSYQYDGELLQELPPIDSLTATPTLLIFHLIGQHVQYRDKFPPSFAHFKPSDEQTPYGGQQGKQIAADYDNATRYNDMVVDSLFRMLAHTDAVAIYLSDHGEEVYDWRDKYERTSEQELRPEIAHYQYEIPLMFYMTDTFQQEHQDLAQRIWASKDRPFISTDLCHTLFYLAGIGTPEYNERHCILSPQYNTHRKRIIRGDVDYDALMKGFKQ